MTAADDPPAWAGLLTDTHAVLLAIPPAVREAGEALLPAVKVRAAERGAQPVDLLLGNAALALTADPARPDPSAAACLGGVVALTGDSTGMGTVTRDGDALDCAWSPVRGETVAAALARRAGLTPSQLVPGRAAARAA